MTGEQHRSEVCADGFDSLGADDLGPLGFELAVDLLDRRKISTNEAWAHVAVVGDEVYVRDLQGLSVYRWKK